MIIRYSQHPVRRPRRSGPTNDNGLDEPATAPIERSALRLARTILLLELAGELDARRASETIRLCMLLVDKIARLPPSFGGRAKVSALDTLTTLMQLERALEQLRTSLASVQDANVCAALRDLEGRLEPLAGTRNAVGGHLSMRVHG